MNDWSTTAYILSGFSRDNEWEWDIKFLFESCMIVQPDSAEMFQIRLGADESHHQFRQINLMRLDYLDPLP